MYVCMYVHMYNIRMHVQCTYTCAYACMYVHMYVCTVDTVFWEISQVHSYDILVINTRPQLRLGLCNNKDIILILGYNYNISLYPLG